MIAVGVDTHKHEHVAKALDGLGQGLGGILDQGEPARLPRAAQVAAGTRR